MWTDALELTRTLLGEDDYEYVARFASPEQMLQDIQQLQNKYIRDKPSAARLLGDNNNRVSPACVWGVVCLLVQLSSRCDDDDALREITRYLSELSQKIELFEVYVQSKSIHLDPALLNRFFVLLVDLVVACARAIKIFRRNGGIGTGGGGGGGGSTLVMARSSWNSSVQKNFAQLLQTFTMQGGQLLLRLARKDVATTTPKDIEVAEELSEMLGGLALALDITARQILVKKKTMAQFLPYFIKNKQNLRKPPRHAPNNPYYNETLVTVWQTAFDSLDDTAAQLLQLFCFYAPDDIPREMIHREDED
ncbi:hypothetical protein Sste5346_005944 [Sporothrix stenoceras]|uniref:CYRIA/CYRIB Rac1 binding domain-containing protein n=1 Tax=Sporothrix stenoceras TaxID=5173 RepID=A0ABR3Z0L2_9PEZI